MGVLELRSAGEDTVGIMQQCRHTMQVPQPLILDGGVGHLLKSWGVTVSGLPYDQQFLAGVLANLEQPELVARAHAAYLEAGARSLTTNNFVATTYNLSKVQRQQDLQPITQASHHSLVWKSCQQQGPSLTFSQQAAGQHARSAADQYMALHQDKVLVLGSLPPLQESYQVEGLPSHAAMVQEYQAIASALQPYVDVLLAETLSTTAEALAAAEATASMGLPLWVSFTLEDSLSARLRSGEPITDAVASIAAAAPHLGAVLVNCCAPATVSAAMPLLKAAVPPGARIGGYANGFQMTTSQWLKGDSAAANPADPGDFDGDGIITPDAYARHAQNWMRAGAQLVGGCCGVGPLHIHKLAE